MAFTVHVRLLAFALMTACSASDACVPGTTVSCLCSTGSMGAQSCLSDGTGYGACACAGYDAGPLRTDAAPLRDGGAEDASGEDAMTSDAGDDASGSDAGAIGSDAGPRCPMGFVHDPPTDRCYTTGPSLCEPPRLVPLRWATTEDQLRLATLLTSSLGVTSGGTDLVRRTSSWTWSDGSSAPRIEWAPGEPNTLLTHTYLRTDGLYSYHRARSTYFCMLEETP